MTTEKRMKVMGEGGVHRHRLSTRTETEVDGMHKHLFFVGDRLLMTDLSGDHKHPVNVRTSGVGPEASPQHKHTINVRTEEGVIGFETDTGGDHGHELQSDGTTISGLHTHTAKIGEQTFVSLLPGDLLEAVEQNAKKKPSLKSFQIKKSQETPLEMNFNLVKRLNKSDFSDVLQKSVVVAVVKGMSRLIDGLQIESLVLSRDTFEDLGAATRFVLDSGLGINSGDERDDVFVFGIRSRDRFQETSLQRIRLTDGVEAVVGLLEDPNSEKEDGSQEGTLGQFTDRNKEIEQETEETEGTEEMGDLKSKFASVASIFDDDEQESVTKRDGGKSETTTKKFVNWKTGKNVSGTVQEKVHEIAEARGINRKFVTIEHPQKRYVEFATSEFELVDAVYQESARAIGHDDDDEPNFRSFYAKGDNVDVVMVEAGRWGSDLVIFFDDAEDLDSMFTTEIKNYEYGAYEYVQTMMGPELVPVEVDKTADPILDEELFNNLKRDTDLFFSEKTEKFFKDNNLVYKRGIFMYGPPGNGKTTFIKYFITNFKKSYSILCEPRNFDPGMGKFLSQRLGKDAKKVIVFEDVDAIVYDYMARSALLNFLDGAGVVDKTLFMATSNYPGRLDSALTKRPSRFDQRYKIDLPNRSMRKKFLKKFFPDLSGDQLDLYAQKTEGFSGAYFKELFILRGMQDCTIDKAVRQIRAQIDDVMKSVNKSAPERSDLALEHVVFKAEEEQEDPNEPQNLKERFARALSTFDGEDDDEEDTTKEKTKIFFDIVKKDNEKRLVTGPVLIPENFDLQEDIIGEDEIESASHNYMIKLNFRDDPEFLEELGLNQKSKRGFMHQEFNRKIALVETFIAPVDFALNKRDIVKGTWVMTVKVFDDEVWNLVKAGKITGFSIGGRSRAIPVEEK